MERCRSRCSSWQCPAAPPDGLATASTPIAKTANLLTRKRPAGAVYESTAARKATGQDGRCSQITRHPRGGRLHRETHEAGSRGGASARYGVLHGLHAGFLPELAPGDVVHRGRLSPLRTGRPPFQRLSGRGEGPPHGFYATRARQQPFRVPVRSPPRHVTDGLKPFLESIISRPDTQGRTAPATRHPTTVV